MFITSLINLILQSIIPLILELILGLFTGGRTT